MAAIYDALGNYVGDDGAPAGNTPSDIAKMRATLGAKLDARSPLPQQRQISDALRQLMAIDAKPLSIDDIYMRLTTPRQAPKGRPTFADLQADIATLPQQVSDVANTLFGNPFQMMVRTPIEALLTGQTSTPQVNALMDKNVAPMQTPQGAAFAERVGRVFEESKLPHAWPAIPNAPRRPMLTGSDIRAMKGDAARLATQLGEIPADFQAAQTGFQRIDPITGKPTMGSRLQSLADEWAGIMERRQSLADEVTPMQALSAPEMYAVRRKGTRLVEPTRPETAVGTQFNVDPATNLVQRIVGARELAPYNAMAEWRNIIADEFPNQLYDDMKRYAGRRIAEMYPDVDPRDAKRAFDLEFGDRDANATKIMELYSEFLNSDAAAAGRQMANDIGATVITPNEFMERHKMAVDWLRGPFSNYIVRNVGTEGDPLVALAAQGITYRTPTEIQNVAGYASDFAKEARRLAGMPEAGLVAPQLEAKQQQLAAAQQELSSMEAQRQQILDAAEAQGVDPMTMPGYAESTNPIRAKARQVEQLNQEVENLKLGSAYEAVADASLVPRTQEQILRRDLASYERPFYPSVTRAAPTEQLYVGRESTIANDLGLEKVAKDAYRDIIEGKIPADQLKNLTVEKYVRKGAEKRIAKEAEEAKLAEREKTVVADAAKQQLDMAQIYLDNSSVIEVTSAMSPEDIAKVLSMDTLVLDHCVGQCGQAPDNARNLFTGEHQTYRSIYDFNKNKVAKGNPLDYSYVRSVADGDKMLASIRDKQTGLPAATLDFNRQSDGTYSIGYVSGYRNKEITPQYYADIAKYLNQYADRITHISSELVKNTTVRDTTDTSQYRDLASKASTQLRVPVDEIRNVDPLGLPRFVTQKQFNEYVQANMPEQAARQQGNIARIERNSELRRQYDALSEEADRAEGLIGHFEMLQDARGLSAEETQTLQAVRDRLEQIINEQITLDAELNPPQDWEPDPTHPANAPIDGLQLFQDLQQPEPRTYEQLMIDANSVIGTIERINERIANATTPEQRAELTNAQRVYVNTLAVINRDMEALQQQREQLPAPPAEVRLQPEQVPPTLLNNDALAARMTNDMLADATPMVEHLREQMEELRRDGEGPDAIRGFLEEVRDNAELYFGEADPLTVEYAIRVAEGTWRPGFAKGGIVKKKVQMTKSIPAMRAELLRRA